MAFRRATASAIFFVIKDRSEGIRVNDEILEEDHSEQVVSDNSLFQDDEGLKDMLSPLEADALVEVHEQLDLESTDSEENPFNPKQMWAFRQLKKLMKQGKEKEIRMTCEEIQQHMLEATQEAAQLIEPACQEEGEVECDYASWHASLNVDSLVTVQNKIVGLAAAADKKRCLPESMPPAEVTSSFLQSVPLVHEYSTASTSEGKERLQEAYLQLVSFQQGIVSFADEVADRKLLLSRDIDEETCQSMGCGHCDRRGSSAFGFRCLLKTANEAAQVQGDGKVCTLPQKRRFTWFRRYDYETQCTVLDWKQAAVQQVQLSAAMSCASTVLAVSVRSELTPESRQAMYTSCMGHQQSGEIDEVAKAQYKEQLTQVDEAVSRADKAVAGLVLTLGQVSGLAALRAASRGNRAAYAQLEESGDDLAEEAELPLTAPFAQHLLKDELAAREEDVAMYVNQELLQRGPVEQRLEKSRAAQLQGSTDIVAVGLMPLVLFAVENRGGSGGASVAADARKVGRGVLVLAFVLVMVLFAVQIYLAHIITMALLGLLTAAGAAKVILYVLGFLFIGLPVSTLILNGISAMFCALGGGSRKRVDGAVRCVRGGTQQSGNP